MDEREREDMVIAVSNCIEANHCAIKREVLYSKFKNTSRDDISSIVDVMKRRKMILYEENRDVYRLVIR